MNDDSTKILRGLGSSKQVPDVSGQRLGNYELLEHLDEGGMGIIYSARHASIGKKVAIKLLRSEFVHRKPQVQRFFNEARVVNEIGHPNIIDIVDFVEEPNASPPLIYMVMELLEGENLAARLERTGYIPVKEAVWIAMHVAEALVAVHRRDILHRDLKPGNIFLSNYRFGADVPFPRVKLLDFGVARIPRDNASDPKTEPGIAVGTPRYMAPEQIRDRPLDERTDIFSLGVVLYKMLCGKTPFDSDSIGEVIADIVNKNAPPLSEAAEGKQRIPAEVEAIVKRCLARDPARRFHSSQELLATLSAWYELNKDAEGELGRNYSITDLLVAPRRSSLTVLALTGGIIVALLALLVIWTGQRTESDPEVKAVTVSPPVVSPLPPDMRPARGQTAAGQLSGDDARPGEQSAGDAAAAGAALSPPDAAPPDTRRRPRKKKPARRRPAKKGGEPEDISSGTMNPYK